MKLFNDIEGKKLEFDSIVEISGRDVVMVSGVRHQVTDQVSDAICREVQRLMRCYGHPSFSSVL